MAADRVEGGRLMERPGEHRSRLKSVAAFGILGRGGTGSAGG